jgi:YD repeat-containing protein
MILVAATGFVYDGENRLLKATSPAFAVTTYAYGGDGLRGSYQKPGQPAKTMVWDGSDYLGEI